MSFRYVDLDDIRKKKSEKKEEVVEEVVADEPVDETPAVEPEIVNAEPEVTTVEETVQTLMAKVIGIDELRVRQAPEGKVLGTIAKGTEVKVLENNGNGWFHICAAIGLSGWCMEQFLLTYYDTVTVDG